MNWWSLLKSGASDAAFNMAMDEALLESMPRLRKPVLRFYGWTESAASFGYFQRYGDVERATHLRPLVRRPTAGGIVPHDSDWTYCLAFPTGHEWHSLRAVESYRRVHEWIQAAFAFLNIPTELAPHCKKSSPGQCFEGHEQFDLLWRGKKVAGAAQRRSKTGLLIQGSIQPPSISTQREDWQNAMCKVAETEHDVGWQQFDRDDIDLSQRIGQLERKKYLQPSYNQRR
jgi:lipoate-protein ligase A